MKIEILGTGCSKCGQLEQAVKAALASNGFKAEVMKVTEIDKIIEYGVMSTPALVVDGKVKCSGRIPDAAEIAKWLKK